MFFTVRFSPLPFDNLLASTKQPLVPSLNILLRRAVFDISLLKRFYIRLLFENMF